MNPDLRLSAKHLPYPQDIEPDVPINLLYSSDDLGWNGFVLRGFQQMPFALPSITLAENLIVFLLRGRHHLTTRAEGKTEREPAYEGNVSLHPKFVPIEYAWTAPAVLPILAVGNSGDLD